MPSVTPDSANIALLRFNQQSGTPATPASGFSGIFCKADGLYLVDDGASVVGPFGSGGVVLAPASSAQNVILPTAGDYTPLTVRGYASAQTAPLFVAKEGSAGTEVFSISGTGSILMQPFTDSATAFQFKDKDGGTPIVTIDSTNERVGIGTLPSYTLDVSENKTSALGGFMSSIYGTWAPTVGGSVGFDYYTTYIEADYDSSNTTSSGKLVALNLYADVLDTGTINTRVLLIENYNDGTGTIGTMESIYIDTISNNGGGGITNAYGIRIANQNEATNNYAIYTNAGNLVFNAANSTGNITFGATPVSANYDLGLVGDGVLMLKETTTPTADTNYGKIYCKNDNKVYFQDGAGVEHEIAFV